MPDWLHDAIDNGQPLASWGVLMVRILLAMLVGFLVAAIYRFTLGSRKETRTMPSTLVLLCLLIALVTMVIGNSVARAFGLVGALSIVRFRTVVEDTRDTAFVIFAVVMGMAIGAGYAVLSLIGAPAVATAALILKLIDEYQIIAKGVPATLTVRLGLGMDPKTVLAPVLDQLVEVRRLTGSATARQGAALELTYWLQLKAGVTAFDLVSALNRIEGIQGAEMKENTER